MAKIHIDCEDVISACEKAIKSIDDSYDNGVDVLKSIDRETGVMGVVSDIAARREMIDRFLNKKESVDNLMHGAAYLKYKNRRLILDTQSSEFSLISSHLIKDSKNE